MRRAMEHFPLPQAVAEMLRRHFKRGGRAPGAPYSLLPMYPACAINNCARCTPASPRLSCSRSIYAPAERAPAAAETLVRCRVPVTGAIPSAAPCGRQMDCSAERTSPGATGAACLPCDPTARIRSVMDSTPTSRPSSSTTGSRRTRCSAMRASTVRAESECAHVTMSRVITFPTGTQQAGWCLVAAAMQMSRSVMTPTSAGPSMTLVMPRRPWVMDLSSSVRDALGLTVGHDLCIKALIFSSLVPILPAG